MMLRSLWVVFFVFMGSSITHASSLSSQPTYGGPGCPAGTAEISLTEKGAWRIKFKDFKLGKNKKRLDRKSCAIAIPIEVEPGHQIALNQGLIVGLYRTGERDTSNIRAEMFFSGSTGEQYLWKLKSDRMKAKIFKMSSQDTWTNCGESQIVRLNLSGYIQTEDPGHSQINVPGAIIGALQTRPCQ